MIARATTFALLGLDSRRVEVEVDVRRGLPAFTVVGLAGTAVREARERVHAAIQASGFGFPGSRITANLAPADLRKAGSGFDLALACALLAASGQLDPERLQRWALYGELALQGDLRPVRGVLAVAMGARRAGFAGLIVPARVAPEAALVPELVVAGVDSLHEAVAVVQGRAEPAPVGAPDADGRPHDELDADLADVHGHPGPIAAIELASAGAHNLLLEGPPGTGKTMLARRVPGLLPPLTRSEALEVTRIHSVAGLHHGGLLRRRPFRAPHHSISVSGLVGGGAVPLPGEATLAHHGVLFMDELSEFPRASLEALRQPLEDGHLVVVRGQRAVLFPSRFMLVAATNPCPCGYYGEPRCRCTEALLARHARRLSGPLLDRIDVHAAVARPTAADLQAPAVTASAVIRARVHAARDRQLARYAGTPVTANAHLSARMVRELVQLTPAARRLMARCHEHADLSARGHHRVLRVARTAADLDGSALVDVEHVRRALGFRTPAAVGLAA